METAVAEAKRRNPKTDASVFDFIRNAVVQVYPAWFDDEAKAEQLAVAGKFQQLTAR